MNEEQEQAAAKADALAAEDERAKAEMAEEHDREQQTQEEAAEEGAAEAEGEASGDEEVCVGCGNGISFCKCVVCGVCSTSPCACAKLKVEVLGKNRRQFRFDMTDAEVREKAMEAAGLTAEMREKTEHLKVVEDQLKAEKKTLEAEISALMARREKIDNEIQIGKVLKYVDVEERKNWEAEEVQQVRLDTGEIISSRPFTDADRQKELPFKENEEGEQVDESGDASASDDEDTGGDQDGDKTELPNASGEDRGPVYEDGLGRQIFVSDGQTGSKFCSYTSKGENAGNELYDKAAMPPVDTKEEAIAQLVKYAEENQLKKVC